jgi:uncharacterized membrane protein YdfJ with MMPL/SSD domain
MASPQREALNEVLANFMSLVCWMCALAVAMTVVSVAFAPRPQVYLALSAAVAIPLSGCLTYWYRYTRPALRRFQEHESRDNS